MGSVYRARDARLQHALGRGDQVLPAHLAASPDAAREVRAGSLSVAKLSNPNILSIFEFR
jgi:hypothetical protein